MYNNKIGIYCIENIINNKKYIGSSRNIYKRMSYHFSSLEKQNHHNSYLQSAYNKYKKETFKFYVLEYVKDDSFLIEKEQYWIDFYDSFHSGYNLQKDALRRPGNFKHSEKTKEILRIKNTRPCTEERKLKISLGNKGKKLTVEHIENSKKAKKIKFLERTKNREFVKEIKKLVRAFNRRIPGKKHTKETKEKLSIAHKGKIISKEQREKISNTLKGRKISKEVLIKYCVPVFQLSKDKKILIAEYESVKKAKEILNINSSGISGICQNKKHYNTAKGFSFVYKNEETIKQYLMTSNSTEITTK